MTTAFAIAQYDQITGKTAREPVPNPRVWLRVHSNFDTETSQFSYSLNGKEFTSLGPEFVTVFQLRTFQGVRFVVPLQQGWGARRPGDFKVGGHTFERDVEQIAEELCGQFSGKIDDER